jgi:hypothetical protein
VSRKHRTGQSGKGRPTPPRSSRGPKSRPTPARSSARTATKGKGPVYRQRRYPPLPLRWKLFLAALWVAALVATILLVEPNPARVGVMIAVTFALPLLVVLVRDPSRRTRR